MKTRFTAKTLAGVGILTAIVVVLQLVAMFFLRFSMFSLTFVLVPIVIGAALYGVWAGAWLGFVFGAVVLISGDASPFLAVNVFGTIATVLVKGILAGTFSGLTYRLFSKDHPYLAVILAAVVCPVTNTGVFLIGCLLFFMETISGWARAAGFESAGAYMILGLAGTNFLIELAVNVILAPVILRIIKFARRRS
ncbi:MAG: ECF transporter S component [Lachnospiraceae bacterium]|nr:ECF transporter S component [Lachnospiraceae bacterium]